jgi:hypothetical protein
MPAGEYGSLSAANTAAGLRSSLPHIRIGLLVGIGAGIPTTTSANGVVCLGDVVVGNPDGVHGGVVQYDPYKARIKNGEVHKKQKGFLNSPPRVLREALSALQVEHETS